MEDLSSYFQKLVSSSNNMEEVLNYSSGLHFSLAGHDHDLHPQQPLFCTLDQLNNSHAHVAPSLPSIQGRKRKRKNEGEEEQAVINPREVVHVRAKRGQATDSHSLAERVRRERINEKIRVLQDLVPGCYKTMGMAVMLDVIINYVRSLQNQIEFLSMKLSAASLFYDFNSPEAEAFESLQRTANLYEGSEMKRMAEGGNNGGGNKFHSTTCPF